MVIKKLYGAHAYRHSKSLISAASVAALISLSGCQSMTKNQNIESLPLTVQGSLPIHNNSLNTGLQQKQSITLLNAVSSEQLTTLLSFAQQNSTSLLLNNIDAHIAFAQNGSIRFNNMPSLQFGYDASRRNSQVPTNSVNNSYQARLVASWELDIWGKLLLTRKSGNLGVQQALVRSQAATKALLANIIRSYVSVAESAQLLQTSSRRVQYQQQLSKIIEARLQNGLATVADKNTQTIRNQQAQMRLAQVEQRHLANKSQLLSLLGIMPNDWQVSSQQETLTRETKVNSQVSHEQIRNLVHEIQTFPKSVTNIDALPLSNLNQRPDIQQAYLGLQKARVDQKLSYRQVLPSLNINTSLNNMATEPLKVLTQDPLWQLVGSLAAPILTKGQHTSRIKVHKLQLQKSSLTLQKTITDAVNTVNKSYMQAKGLRKQLANAKQIEQISQTNMRNSTNVYLGGGSTVQMLLGSKLSLCDAQDTLSQIRAQKLISELTLVQELGL